MEKLTGGATIKIRQTTPKKYGLFFEETLLGESSLNCDCVLAAKRIQACFETPSAILIENEASVAKL